MFLMPIRVLRRVGLWAASLSSKERYVKAWQGMYKGVPCVLGMLCLWPRTVLVCGMVQVGQVTRAPNSEGEIKLQYADGSTSDHVKVDLVAKAS